jgi:hypothetical protein
VLAEGHVTRIARDQARDGKGDEQDAQEHGREQEQATEKELAHQA